MPSLPIGTGILYAEARVAFYQDVNGTGYLLPSDVAFGVEVVGVGDE